MPILPVLLETRLDLASVGCIGEVGRQHLGSDSGLVLEPCGERFELGPVARHQDEIVAAPGQPVGIDGADARGGAGDEGGAIDHCELLFG